MNNLFDLHSFGVCIVLKTNLEVQSTMAEITLTAGRERVGTFTNVEDSLLTQFPGLCPSEVSPS